MKNNRLSASIHLRAATYGLRRWNDRKIPAVSDPPKSEPNTIPKSVNDACPACGIPAGRCNYVSVGGVIKCVCTRKTIR